MAKIVFYGGVNEIGGNKFLLEDGDAKLFLDFGKNFAREKEFFEEPYIKAREEQHLLSIGILPRIDGLYKDDTNELEIDGFLASHPHADHYDAIRWTKNDFPIHCAGLTKDAIVAREKSTRPPKKKYNIAYLTGSEETERPFRPMSFGQQMNISSLKVTVYPVDHSVPGACGSIIETSNGVVVYTGDLRMHGRRGQQTEQFIQKAKESAPEVLLIEGTHIGESKRESEAEVEEDAGKLLSQTSGLVLLGQAVADMDRLLTFLNIAKENDRKLVISLKQAYIADSLKGHDGVALDPGDDNVLIYKKKKTSYDEYQKRVMADYNNIVGAGDLSGMQNEAILVASIYDMNDLGVIKPATGSIYILSSSEPFDEEMEIQYDKLLNWMDYYGIPLYQTHASGHATPHELKDMIKEISPKTVIPIHTNKPGLFRTFMKDVEPEIHVPSEDKPFEW